MRRAITMLVLAALAVGIGYAGYLHWAPQRPPAEAEEEGEEQGGVELSDQQIAAAGIELDRTAPAALRDSLQLNGVVQPNQEMLVQVTPRFPGVIRSIRKRIGDQVERGESLASVESNQSLTAYDLKAPIAGTIIDRQAALGEFVSEQKPVFVVADLSTIWIDFSVFRGDLGRVAAGDRVVIDPEDGGPPIDATISYVSPLGASDTQSGLARAVLPNPGLRLRSGLFVAGRLILREKPVALSVKASAIQSLDERPVVFVKERERFEAREVKLGASDPERTEILAGLHEGDVYAARNSFVIKAELAKASVADDD